MSSKPTKGVPSIPDVPSKLTEADIYRILDPIKRILDIRQGKFSPTDKWITNQDLIDSGITTQAAVDSPVVVVPGTVQYDFSLSGDIIGAKTKMGTGNPTNMATLINLPNVVCIDGGDAAETYPGELTGPFGVAGGGGGSALEIEDTGNSLTGACTLINFVGFQMTESNDEVTISIGGPADASDLFSPGYTYTQLSGTSFSVDGFDVRNLFRINRRLKINGGGVDSYGSIASVSYGAPDTTVTMTMEGGGTVPATISDLWFAASDSQWSPIASDPFGGDRINAIATGAIDSTQWWVAVGDNGKLFTSNDKGVTWTVRASGTTGNIYAITYDGNNERFIVGGIQDGGTGYYLRDSINGTVWVDRSNSSGESEKFLGLASTAGDYCYSLSFCAAGDYLILGFYDAGTYRTYVNVAVWTGGFSSRVAGSQRYLGGAVRKIGATDDQWSVIDNSLFTAYYTSFSDTSSTSWGGQVAAGSAIAGFNVNGSTATSDQFFRGDVVGGINMRATNGFLQEDYTTFSQQINGFAASDMFERVVCVGNNSQIGYVNASLINTSDSWVEVANGFDPTTDVLGVDFNESDGVFVAVAANGQICRSTNGTN